MAKKVKPDGNRKFKNVARIPFIEEKGQYELYFEQAIDMGLDYSSWFRLGIKRFIGRGSKYKISFEVNDGLFRNPKVEASDKEDWTAWAKKKGYVDFTEFVRSASLWFYTQTKAQSDREKEQLEKELNNE